MGVDKVEASEPFLNSFDEISHSRWKKLTAQASPLARFLPLAARNWERLASPNFPGV
jgi:hypothetical protein